MPTGLHLAGLGVLALLDEGLGHRGEVADRAVDPDRRVDAVGEEVAGDAGARRLDVEPPGAGAALRHVRDDRPVLEEVGAVVEDLSELARGDHLLDQGHRRDRSGNCTRPCWGRFAFSTAATIVSPSFVVAGERLFAEHHLAGLRGGDGDLHVEVVRDADVDRVDVVARDQRLASRSRPTRSPSARRSPRPWPGCAPRPP